MKKNRRDFIKLAGFAGAGVIVGPDRAMALKSTERNHLQSFKRGMDINLEEGGNTNLI